MGWGGGVDYVPLQKKHTRKVLSSAPLGVLQGLGFSLSGDRLRFPKWA